MKNLVFIFFLLVPLSMTYKLVKAQDPADKIEKEGEKRINKSIDQGINKGFDAIEQGFKGFLNHRDTKLQNQNQSLKTRNLPLAKPLSLNHPNLLCPGQNTTLCLVIR